MARYLVAAVVAFLLLLGLLLLVRPMIYSVAPPRDDSVYAVVTAASVPTTAPVVKELLPPGTISASHLGSAPTSLLGSEKLRQAGEGRFSPRTEMLRGGPSRAEIARSAEEAEAAEAAFDAALRDAEDATAERDSHSSGGGETDVEGERP